MYSEPNLNLYLGDAREVLKTLPAESVDMVMTSPPYYGLRAYKAEPLIWDAQDCQHEWGEAEHPPGYRKTDTHPGPLQGIGTMNRERIGSNFCTLCNAWKGQLGSEPTPDLYIKHLCDIFDDVKRVIKKTGSIYINLDDSHNSAASNQSGNMGNAAALDEIGSRGKQLNSIPAKSLIGIPERFMLEMIARKWICRNVIIWHKDSVMPESVKDRFTIDFERIFFFSKSPKYFFERQFEPSVDAESYNGRRKRNAGTINDEQPINYGFHGSIQDDGTLRYGQTYPNRNKRTTWTINPQGFNGPHYATYPEELCRTPIEASCPEFVCTKCGKPRQKIYESDNHSRTMGDPKLFKSNPVPNDSRMLGDGACGNPEIKLIGLSDCKCGAPLESGIVLDPFSGVATTGVMAKKLGRKYIGIEISEKYHKMAIKRIQETVARMI